jgi:hypothetical protein
MTSSRLPKLNILIALPVLSRQVSSNVFSPFFSRIDYDELHIDNTVFDRKTGKRDDGILSLQAAARPHAERRNTLQQDAACRAIQVRRRGGVHGITKGCDQRQLSNLPIVRETPLLPRQSSQWFRFRPPISVGNDTDSPIPDMRETTNQEIYP